MNLNIGDRWKDDSIQFPRLLAEIWAGGLMNRQIEKIAASMDLTEEEVAELFERAEGTWDGIKEKL